MKLLKLAERPLVFDSEDAVSKAISKMRKEEKTVAVVMTGGKYAGLLSARELSKRKISNPDRTKIRNFIQHIEPVSPETDVNEAINSILVNDYASLPLEHEKRIFLLDKTSILRRLKNEDALKGKSAGNVMAEPFCISSSDSISVAISTLRDAGVTRLPVVGDGNRVDGLVDAISLLSADIKRKRPKKGERRGEKIKLGEVSVRSLMKKNIIKVKAETPLKEAMNRMIKQGTHTVLVEEGGKLAGIITPKMILGLMYREAATANVRISGLQKEDPFLKDIVRKETKRLTDKLAKMVRIERLVVDIDRYHEKGKRVKYSVKTRLATEKATFFAKSHGWDLTKAVREALNRLEREALHRKGKIHTIREGADKW